MTRVREHTPFVGRDAERAVLRQLLEDASRGRGGLVMLAGEPGVGKTRMAEELAAEARTRGFLTLTGYSYDMEGGLPYQPFVEAVEALARAVSAGDLRQWLGEDAPEIARLVPELRRLFPDLPVAPEVPPEAGRRMIHGAWIALLERLARAQPLVLVLDDVHWADESSLLLLQHVARVLPGMAVLVVCTYRDVELGLNRSLAAAMRELTRQHLAYDVMLSHLPEAAVAEMIASHGASPPPVALVSLIYRESDGNPFFVEEVLRRLAEEGRLFASDGAWANAIAINETEVPRGARLVIEQRLAHLSEGCRHLLANAAVIGRDFSHDVAGALSGLGPDALIEAIEEAERAALVRDAAVGREARYSFSHELVRQTLLGSLSLPRRQRMHLEVARAMERLYGDAIEPHMAELAYHYRRAGNAAAADVVVPVVLRAAAQAAAVFACGEAAALYDEVLETPELAAVLGPEERCDTLLLLGEALFGNWDLDRIPGEIGPAAYELALAARDSAQAARACWLVVQSIFAKYAFPGVGRPDNILWTARLDEAAPEGTIHRAYADAALMLLAASRGQPVKTAEFGVRAMALIRRLDGPASLMCRVGWCYLLYCAAPRFAATRHEVAEELRRILVERGNEVAPEGAVGAAIQLASTTLEWGDRGELEGTLDLLVSVSKRAAFRHWAPCVRDALLGYLDGDLEAAAAAAEALAEADSAAEQPGVASAYATFFFIWPYLLRGRESPRMRPAGQSTSANWAPLRALVLALNGRIAEARETLAAIARSQSGHGPAAPDSIPIHMVVPMLHAACLVGDPELARWFAAPLWDTDSATTGLFHTTVVKRHLASAAALLGEPERSRTLYQEALGQALARRFRPEVALIRLELGQLLLERFPESHAEAREHVAFALAEFEKMGMAPSVARARTVLAALRAAGPKHANYPDGLSDREVEVLRLLAAGKSNREIAAELVISTRTAERHISNAYDKIGVRGRAATTAYVLRHAL